MSAMQKAEARDSDGNDGHAKDQTQEDCYSPRGTQSSAHGIVLSSQHSLSSSAKHFTTDTVSILFLGPELVCIWHL